MKRKSQKFPYAKPFREIDWTINGGDRVSQRKAMCDRWAKEEPYTNYRYNVEKCEDSKRIYLRRPTFLNKGFDFQVNLEGFRSVTREAKGATKEMPSHKDVIDDLQRKVKDHSALSDDLHKAVSQIYDCVEPTEVLERHKRLRQIGTGLPIDKLLLILKWLFIEQDLTYWLQTGRNMLMSAIEEDVFGIEAPLKG
jgi:hypothetical protein